MLLMRSLGWTFFMIQPGFSLRNLFVLRKP
jgi:hypothetical protein